MSELTMGSLFDGIGGFPLAAVRNGITPVWASEIDPFPIKVTKTHFPDMVHVGDITSMKAATQESFVISRHGSLSTMAVRCWSKNPLTSAARTESI